MIDELRQRILAQFEESIAAKQASLAKMPNEITQACQLLIQCLQQNGKILCCGNGGSAADSQHFAAELVNRFMVERRPLPALALTTDSSILTSIANDYSYDEIFSKQVLALAHPQDVLIAISTSGHSKNVQYAIDAAHQKSACVIAMTGKDGGPIAQMLKNSDIELRVPSKSTARIQEIHELVLHMMCDAIDQENWEI